MYIPFETLPTEARLWLYHIPKPLTAEETNQITQKLQQFCETWEAHKEPLSTSFSILHEQFIALAVDESMHGASGCSIDGSVRIMREIGELLQVDMFDRQYAAYWEQDSLSVVPLATFKKANFSADTEIFDQTVTTLGELKKRQKIKITETWLKGRL